MSSSTSPSSLLNPQPPITPNSVARTGAAISIAGFIKSFPSTTKNDSPVHAVGPVDLHVIQGSITVLIGPSGCGKTTLLKSIGGLLDPSAGSITIGEQSPSQARAAKRFGLVPQAPTLLSWRTVRQNVNLLNEVNAKPKTVGAEKPLSATELDALLVDVGLGGFEEFKPRQLSGGMQQRVALVRAFATGASVLLLDEPFAALDEFTRADMRQVLLKLWEKRKPTIVFTTHSLEEAVLLADHVVVMAPRPGRVVAHVPVGLARPNVAGIEDTREFQDHVTAVRSALREAIISAQVMA